MRDGITENAMIRKRNRFDEYVGLLRAEKYFHIGKLLSRVVRWTINVFGERLLVEGLASEKH